MAAMSTMSTMSAASAAVGAVPVGAVPVEVVPVGVVPVEVVPVGAAPAARAASDVGDAEVDAPGASWSAPAACPQAAEAVEAFMDAVLDLADARNFAQVHALPRVVFRMTMPRSCPA